MREGLLALSFNASVAVKADELSDEKEGKRKDLDLELRKRQRDEAQKRHQAFMEKMKRERNG